PAPCSLNYATVQMARSISVPRHYRWSGDFLENTAEVIAHDRDLLVTVIRILLQCFIDYLLKPWREFTRPHFCEGFRRPMQDLMADVYNCLALKCPNPGHHFIKKDTGRKDVRTGICAFAACLLRSRVSRGPVWDPQF